MNGMQEQRVCLITLGVADLAVSRAFYVDGLGWEPTLDLDEIVFIQVGHGLLIGLWSRDELAADAGLPVPDPGPATISLACNLGGEGEVDAFLERAVAAGATLLKPGRRADFGGYHGYFADPDGHWWEVAHNPGLVTGADGKVAFVDPTAGSGTD